MKLLVDTCTFLWIASSSPRLSKTAAAAFLDRDNERYLSTASAWEIGIKHSAGRLAKRGQRLVSVPLWFAPKLALYLAMRDQRVNNSELASASGFTSA